MSFLGQTHIVFGTATGAMLKQAFKNHQITEPIVAMEDDLMSGPLGKVDPCVKTRF